MALEVSADGVGVGCQVAISRAVWRVAPAPLAIFGVDPLDRAIQRAGFEAQAGDAFVAELPGEAQRAFDGDAAVAVADPPTDLPSHQPRQHPCPWIQGGRHHHHAFRHDRIE